MDKLLKANPVVRHYFGVICARSSFECALSLIIATTVVIVLFLDDLYFPKLYFSADSADQQTIQVFLDKGKGFREQDSLVNNIEAVGGFSSLDFKIVNTDKLRVDFGNDGAKLLVSRIEIIRNGRRINLLPELSGASLHDVQISKAEIQGVYKIIATGDDPFVVFKPSLSDVSGINYYSIVVKYLLLFIVVSLFAYFFLKIYQINNILFYIILIGIIVRFVFFLVAPVPIDVDQLYTFYYDEGTYFKYIEILKTEGLFGYFHRPESIEVAPGVIMYLSFLSELLDSNILLIRIFNVLVLSTALLYFSFKIAASIFGENAGKLSAALVAFYPELIFFSPSMLTEPLFITLTVLFASQLVNVLHKINNQRSFVGSALQTGMVAGLASVTRLVLLPFILIILLFGVCHYFYHKNIKLLVSMLAIGFAFALIVAPFLLNGYKHSGNVMVSTGSGAVLWLGSRKDTEGDEPPYRGKAYGTNEITGGRSHLSLEGDRLLKNAAIENIKQDYIGYALLSIKKIGRLLIGNNYFWFFPQNKFKKWLVGKPLHEIISKLASIFLAIMVAVYGVISFIKYGRQSASVLAVGALVMFLVAIYMPFMVNQRFGLPVYVLNGVLASGYLLSYQQHGRLGVWLPVLIIALIFVYILAGA